MATLDEPATDVLERVATRVLWLAVRMVDAANTSDGRKDEIKVGGHQASSASMVSLMTALWFRHLGPADRVAVKPHASPAFHAIQYLLGNLDRLYLTRLREFGGLQAYPSRTKDPDVVDFSTGSVGLGASAPLFAGLVRRYVDAHFGARPHSRFISLIGDAELDEGSVWESVADPATQGLGNVMWVVDFNRQSLDRVIPGIRIKQWRAQFEAHGWHVREVKYGYRMRAAFSQPGGEALREWIDKMPNEQYQSLFALGGPDLRERFVDGAPPEVSTVIAPYDDAELRTIVTDLGGHDIRALLEAFDDCDLVQHRPSVVFAYTVKGWGLPMAGDPRNHSSLLSPEHMDRLRAASGLGLDTEWDRFEASSAEGVLCSRRREQLTRPGTSQADRMSVPGSTMEQSPARPISTQEVFGRILVDLSRLDSVAPYLVTTAPDVATSTNLASFINRVGVFSPEPRRAWNADPVLKWAEGPTDQHIELGISEMNLFLLLGQVGLSWDLSDQPLLGIGTVYDPFVLRGLDALLYGVYSGARFVLAGTPSGVTLAPEGGAHQSTLTPSVGLEMPGLTFIEPAYAAALDWLLCDALSNVGGDGRRAAEAGEQGAYYFRLTTRPIDQTPFEDARTRLGEAVLRRQVLAGAYRLFESGPLDPANADSRPKPRVHIVACGAVVPEALAAAAELTDEGIAANVVDFTSSDRVFRAWQSTIQAAVRTASAPSTPGVLRAAMPFRAPVVTVHDGSSHHLAWVGSALGVPSVSLGVDSFGQSGRIGDLYQAHALESGAIVNAALAALSLE